MLLSCDDTKFISTIMESAAVYIALGRNKIFYFFVRLTECGSWFGFALSAGVLPGYCWCSHALPRQIPLDCGFAGRSVLAPAGGYSKTRPWGVSR